MDSIVQTKMEETLGSAEEAIEQLQEELHVNKKQTKKLERYVEDRRGKFIKLMLNAPLSRAFRTWRGPSTPVRPSCGHARRDERARVIRLAARVDIFIFFSILRAVRFCLFS